MHRAVGCVGQEGALRRPDAGGDWGPWQVQCMPRWGLGQTSCPACPVRAPLPLCYAVLCCADPSHGSCRLPCPGTALNQLCQRAATHCPPLHARSTIRCNQTLVSTVMRGH